MPRDGDRHRASLERRAARRVELVEAAVSAIRREGPAVSMDVIAAEAGVTKPILYKHFADRDGLIAAIAGRAAAEIEAAVGASLDADLDARELLRSTIDAYLAYVERETNVYRFLVARSAPPLADADDLLSTVARRVAVVLGEQLRAAGRDSGPAEPWAHGIVGFVHLAGDWWLGTRTMPRERLTAYLTSMLWEGLDRAGEQPVG